METYEIEDLVFAYPEREQAALGGISLKISAGDFVVICGESGCGKSTFLRQLKRVLTPNGTQSGRIFFEGRPLHQVSEREQAEKIGFVFQSPADQLVTSQVWHELAFGLESLGEAPEAIRLRVAETASFFGMHAWFYKNIAELSGGQQQLLNLASVMVMNPSVLVLDEPVSQLDPIAARDFIQCVARINRELGTTVIMAAHKLDDLLENATKLALFSGGTVKFCGAPRTVGEQIRQAQDVMYSAMPIPMQIYGRAEAAPHEKPAADCPLSIKEGRSWLEAYLDGKTAAPVRVAEPPLEDKKPVLEAKDLWFRYEKGAPDVVKGFELTVSPGHIYALLGGNGAGKTTAAKLLTGLLRPNRGKICINGQAVHKLPLAARVKQITMLPQNPAALFTENSVFDDLKAVLQEEPSEVAANRIVAVAKQCRITHLLTAHPYDISGGEQQRAALAKILLTGAQVLVLDEPTKGLDAGFLKTLAEILNRLAEEGKTIIMVSHDIEFCAEHAHWCGLLFDGNTVSKGSAHRFFAGNTYYTTAANRMGRKILPDAITAQDVLLALGVEPKQE